nr:dead end [Trichopodus pectoralis]
MERMDIRVMNLGMVQSLETWRGITNNEQTQVNGQRKYGGPPEVWDGPTPGYRCEVFISQIPRDTYEDLLIPLFSSVGPLWEFRLMMNFSGQNRGFAYAKYGSAAVASDAIHLLHGYMLEPGVFLSVRRSTEKRHLCIDDLPASTRQEDLLQVLRVLTEGVERLSLRTGPGIEGVSALVVFASHHTASMAKKMLVEAFKKQFGLTVSVKWQSPLKMSPEKLGTPQKPLKSLLLPLFLNPSHNGAKSQQPSVQHPHTDSPTPIPAGFCKAVARPTANKHPPCLSAFSSQHHVLSTESPVSLLGKLCVATGVGQPLYEIYYSHTLHDGFMYFNYKVSIPGVPTSFKGLVPVLLGPSTSTMLEVVKHTAAQQVLQRVYDEQLAY